MGRVVLFIGAYASLDQFTVELGQELIRAGHEVLYYDIKNTAQSLQKFAQFAVKKIDFALGYNNLGMNMEIVQGSNIWDDLNVLYIDVLMDHPFHYRSALLAAPKKCAVLTCDRNHVDYILRFFPNIEMTAFLPHGSNHFERGSVLTDRKIDVFYAGGLSRDLVGQIMPVMDKYQEFDGEALMKEVLDFLIQNPSYTTEYAIEQYLHHLGVAVSDEQLSEIITDFRVLDSFATSYYRERAVEVLVNAGIDVTVCGKGWEHTKCFHNPHFHFGGFVSPMQVTEMMKDAKIVLNTMTWFKDGSHDRVFNGMLAGAVVVSDSSKYMSETLGKDNAILYELPDTDKLPDIVADILKHPQNYQNMADCGYELVRHGHMMKHRAREIAEAFL